MIGIIEVYNSQTNVDKLDLSTYYGELSPDNVIPEELDRFNDIDIDWEYTKQNIIASVDDTELNTVLLKYGIKITKWDFNMPRYHNYEDDTLDFDFTVNKSKLKATGILESEEFKNYHKNIKQDSYNGYISFEPDIDEISLDNDIAFYGIIYAILDKEDSFYLIKSMVEDVIEDYRCNDGLVYKAEPDMDLIIDYAKECHDIEATLKNINYELNVWCDPIEEIVEELNKELDKRKKEQMNSAMELINTLKK